MINERYLCVGGANKITLIDIYKKIIRKIEEYYLRIMNK